MCRTNVQRLQISKQMLHRDQEQIILKGDEEIRWILKIIQLWVMVVCLFDWMDLFIYTSSLIWTIQVQP